MEYPDDSLYLIYVLKIGHNTNDEGLYEFVFSLDPSNIDIEAWCWDIPPACDNAQPPTKDYYNKIFSLKTDSFDLFCLHEAVDREYMHGYYTIHALAYEVEREYDNSSSYEKMFEEDFDDDVPLLVFHYGMSLAKIKELLMNRKIVLRNNEFIETKTLKF